jgi:nucleoside phosphorylase/tetratricopeptide (TPR) repeat protein
MDRVLIVTATKVEAEEVMNQFSQASGVECKPCFGDRKSYIDLGILGGVDLFMTRSEMGSVTPGGSLTTVMEAVRELSPVAVVMVGICFGAKPDKHQIGDILVSKQIHVYEPQKVTSEGQVSRGDTATASEDLLDKFGNGHLFWKGTPVHFGLMLSGEKLVNDPDFLKKLIACEPEAIGGEMEGAGLYSAARHHGVDWIIVKGICDWADGNKNDLHQQTAARNAAAFVCHVIEQGGLKHIRLSGKQTGKAPEPSPARNARPTDPGLTSDLPLIWNVPHRRNRHFTGREQLLKRMEVALASEKPGGSAVAITGLGGEGKTQLTLEYVYRHRQDYSLVWWIRSESPGSIDIAYRALAPKLGLNLPADTAPGDLIPIVLHRLSAHDKWLLIFDNAEEPENLGNYLPQSGDGEIIITSRNPNWRAYAECIPIEIWQPTEAVEFINKRSGQSASEASGKLAEKLGFLPLALEQATAYIEASGCSIPKYMDLYKAHSQKLLERGKPSTDYPDTVATTWEISFDSLAKASPLAADLLKICAFLAPDDIPFDIFTEGIESLPESMREQAQDPLKFQDARAALRRYSLADVAEDSLSIHRLVQMVIRDRMASSERKQWTQAAEELVNAVYSFDENRLETWTPAAQLLPHAIVVADCIDPATKTHGPWVVRFCDRIGSQLRVMGKFEKGKTMTERAVELAEHICGKDHPVVAIPLSNLGELMRILDDLKGAKRCLELALAIFQKTFGTDHPLVAPYLNSLAAVMKDLGDVNGAKLLYCQALDIAEKTYGIDHHLVAIPLNNLALVIQELGDFKEARKLLERALELDERAHDNDHPAIARDLNNLATVLSDLGELQKARAHLQRALKISEKVYGKDHYVVALRLNNLANVLKNTGELEEAKALLEMALEINERTYGMNHQLVANTLVNYALVLWRLEDFAGAQSLLRRAIAIFKTALGQDHPKTTTARNNLHLLLEEIKTQH